VTTSGTTTVSFSVFDIIEEAYERAGIEMGTGGRDLRSARRSLDLLFHEWANRGLLQWTMEEGHIALTAGTGTYQLPVDTVDLIDYRLRVNLANANQARDIPLTRVSQVTWTNLPQRNQSGRPYQVLVERFRDGPSLRFYPTPDDREPYEFHFWRIRRMEGMGSYTNTVDAPFRFLPALCAGLAFKIAQKRNPAREAALYAAYQDTLNEAEAEDSPRTDLTFWPDWSYR